ncbi:uncharacterized protein [Parasteatoda tepidariorum]|uniref:uncharacterized protein n=1 Tax=Parasteatoda tepidariorum TaxID=114398 RepID=UPI0039BD30BD
MKINLILTVVVLTIINGSRSDDLYEAGHFPACHTWIKCSEKDKAALDEFDTCLDKVPEEKMKKFIKMLAAFAKEEWSDLEEGYNDYCAWDAERQNEYYVEVMQLYMDEYSETCADSFQVATCNKMADNGGCFLDVINRVHAEEKC